MSQHRSFGGSQATARERSVLKRYEKIETLSKKGLWKKEDGILGLPKVKVVKIKAAKSKSKSSDADKEKDAKKEEKSS